MGGERKRSEGPKDPKSQGTEALEKKGRERSPHHEGLHHDLFLQGTEVIISPG